MTHNASKILDIINYSDHPTADDIYMEVKRLGIKMSPATVYNSLAALHSEGAIVKLPDEGGATRYDKSLPHGHMICSACGRISDLFIDDFPDYLRERTGTDTEGYDLRVFHTCPMCRGLV
ncbi:MAG: transcriptional repressor [Oscillospiraceae bacterium]|nr:transcriptional repressor [Oscillospiraceae bacterium]